MMCPGSSLTLARAHRRPYDTSTTMEPTNTSTSTANRMSTTPTPRCGCMPKMASTLSASALYRREAGRSRYNG